MKTKRNDPNIVEQDDVCRLQHHKKYNINIHIIIKMLISIFKKKVLFHKLFLLEHIKNGYKFGHVHVKCLMCPYGAT